MGFGSLVQLPRYKDWRENMQKRRERGNLRKESDTRYMGKEPLNKKEGTSERYAEGDCQTRC